MGVVTIALVAACVAQKPENPVSGKGFVLLTRQGCANTPTMRARLDDALTALQLPGEYDDVDIGSLPKGEVRRGYPTPTLLYEGADVFGLPTPPSRRRGRPDGSIRAEFLPSRLSESRSRRHWNVRNLSGRAGFSAPPPGKSSVSGACETAAGSASARKSAHLWGASASDWMVSTLYPPRTVTVISLPSSTGIFNSSGSFLRTAIPSALTRF